MNQEHERRAALLDRLEGHLHVPRELGLLPLPPEGERLLLTDSHDVTGHNDDGFSSRYSYLHRTPIGWVLFDHKGAGVIRLIRTIGFSGRLLLYLDSEPGRDRPALDVSFEELYSGRLEGFPPHLVADLEKGHGSEWCQVPFAFERRCTAIAAGEPESGPHFYTVAAHVFAAQQEHSAGERARLPDLGSGWSPAPEVRPFRGSARGSQEVPGFGRLVILDAEGPGMVSAIRLGLQRSADALEHLFLRATWDCEPASGSTGGWGSGAPLHVDAPVGLFFAAGFATSGPAGSYVVDHGKGRRHEITLGRERAAGVGVGELADGTLYCRFPMPFWKRARMELVNTSAAPVENLEWDVETQENPYPADCGHFRCVYHREDALMDQRDYRVAELEGSGSYIGCVVRMSSRKDPVQGGFQRGYLEGDARFYIDDARCFQSASTGTEEYFLWGWYDMLPHDRPFSFPTHGYVEHTRDLFDHTAMYRFHYADSVPFHRSFRFDLEHGPTGAWTADYASVAYFYHSEQCLLALAGMVDLGDEEGLRALAFSMRGERRREHRILVYEGNAQVRLAARSRATGDDATGLEGTSRRVVEMTGECMFTLSVDSRNRGVRLRKTSDGDRPTEGAAAAGGGRVGRAPTVPAQEAEVLVNGVRTGTWYVPSRIARPCWMEEEYDIDARYTTGKDHLTITIRSLEGTPWRAASYAVFARRERSVRP